MKTKLLLTTVVATACVISSPGQDLLNKLKKKAGEQVINKIGGQKPNNTGNQNTNTNTNTNTGNNPSNQGGGGLITTPPDVNQNLADADVAFKSNKYGEARYAVQQAMLGVEMEIGNKVLKSLPVSVSGLKAEAESDQVTSTGWGWAGLTIHREYSNNDKQFSVTVANNAAWMSAINMYFSAGGYAQTTGGQQNWKQTKVKGYRAIIEYSEGSGYKLSVPLGQSSLVVFEGVNFASEPEMMAAATTIDLDGIRKMLGEQ
jgi:hypothetical protein